MSYVRHPISFVTFVLCEAKQRLARGNLGYLA